MRGKLYPAISCDMGKDDCKVSARFWEGGPNGNSAFMFQGPFDDSTTFMTPDTPAEPHAESDQSSDTSSVYSADSYFSYSVSSGEVEVVE